MDLNLVLAVLTEDNEGIRHNLPKVRYGKWETNSHGFRGKEIDLEKKEGQVRVVCLGGSEAFGVFEDEGKEWPAQLGEFLRTPMPNIEVLNASVAGLTLKKKKAYIEKYVLPLKPDILITTQGALLPITDSIRGVESKRLMDKFERRKTDKVIGKSPDKKLFLSVLFRIQVRIESWLPNGYRSRLRMRRLRKRIKEREKRYLIDQKPMDEVPQKIISEFEEDLRSFVRYLKEKEMTPILLTYPTLFTQENKKMHRYLLLSIRRLCVELSEDGIIQASAQFNEVIRRVAERETVALIDQDLLIPKTLEYFVDYSHYTNQGAELIAKNIYQFLTEKKFLESATIHHKVREGQ